MLPAYEFNGFFAAGDFSRGQAESHAASLPTLELYLFLATPSRIRRATIPRRLVDKAAIKLKYKWFFDGITDFHAEYSICQWNEPLFYGICDFHAEYSIFARNMKKMYRNDRFFN